MNDLIRLLFGDIEAQRVALVSLGGMGKTQIALQLAYMVKEEKRDYSVFWMPALSLASYEQACARIVSLLGIPHADGDDSKELVRLHLSSDRAGNWLLILDNADNKDILYGHSERPVGIYNSLPHSDKGRILITTRSREVAVEFAQRDVVELPAMSPKEAEILLEKSLIRQEDLRNVEALTSLLEKLTYLPLAIAQAAAYVNINKISITEYLRLCRNTDQDMIALLRNRFRDDAHYSATQGAVATTWIISFNRIRQTDTLAARLLSFISWIEPKAIPRSMMPSPGSEQELTQAIGTLSGYGFLSKRHDGDTFDMHSLAHLATRIWIYERGFGEVTERDVLTQLTRVFPSDDWENHELWQRYLPHALRVLQSGEDAGFSELGYCVGRCLIVDGRFREALEVLNRVVAIRDKTLAEEHPGRLASQHALARVYQANGQVQEAVKLLEHVVAIEGNTLAEEHPDRLASQHALAIAYQASVRSAHGPGSGARGYSH